MNHPGANVVSKTFYVWLAVAYLTVAVVGFGQTYGLPAASGRASFNPAVHVHGWLQLLWLLFFLTQSLLVVSGRTAQHRALGLFGISLATLLVATAIPAALNRANLIVAAGAPTAVAQQFIGSVVLEEIYFGALVALAIGFVKKPPIHRRLLAAATLVNVGAAFNRLYTLYAPATAQYFYNTHHLEIAILTGDLLMIAMLINDWRTDKRIHPATAMSLGALLVLHVIRVPLNTSAFSQSLGAFFSRFVGA